jgi:surfeit locus 1 family protein
VSWRFLLRPKWIVRHVVVVTLVMSMAVLGMWQLRRLDDKREHNRLVEDRQEMAAAPVQDLVRPGTTVGDAAVDAVLYRSVTAVGTYLDDDTVVVENRSLNGSSGAWVLTPLRLDDQRAVVVNRGFLRFNHEGEIVAPRAPAGRVSVEGLLLASQQRGRFGATDAAGDKLDVLARVDVERMAAQVAYDLLPAYVQLVVGMPSEDPVPAGAPAIVPLGPPQLDEGPHLSYAVQWFIFTTIASGGYVLLLRRVASEQAEEGRRPSV